MPALEMIDIAREHGATDYARWLCVVSDELQITHNYSRTSAALAVQRRMMALSKDFNAKRDPHEIAAEIVEDELDFAEERHE